MIDIAVINEGWPDTVAWEALFEDAVTAAVAASAHAALITSPVPVEVAIRLSGDEEVRALNREWRDKDKATNVLSFPMCEREDLAALVHSRTGGMLGDIILAQGVCATEASEQDISLEAHAAHLVVHGVLHLLGYDHMGDEDASEMESTERRVLAGLGLHDPYQD